MGSGRLQEHNHPGTVLGRCEPAIWLHVVAGHDLIGFRDEAIELLLVPYKVRVLHGAGIAVVRERLSPSLVVWQVRHALLNVSCPDSVSAPLRAGSWATAENPRSIQECGADQPNDCGSRHKASSPLAIERAVATVRSSLD